MAQPNVVREPSMDEILASIRRIIESNEPLTQAGVATAMAEPEGFSGRPANDDSEEVTLTVDDRFGDRDQSYAPVEATPPVLRAIADADTRAVSPGFQEMQQPSFAQPSPPPQKSLSLADVAARVRAASERSSAAVRDGGLSQMETAETPAPAMARPAPAPVATPEPVRVEQVEEAVPDYADEPQASFVEPSVEEEESYRPEPVSLLSSSTGEQVARSFQDLAIALENAERRSLDEIAEDMLRPMLQEWLDDNLPTLVERLVREEIERVARGPRR